MPAINTHLSILILNNNDLSSLIKRHRLAVWINKQNQWVQDKQGTRCNNSFNGLKGRHYTIISVNAETDFDKIQYAFMIRVEVSRTGGSITQYNKSYV